MKIFFNGQMYTKFVIENNTFFLTNDINKMKCKDVVDFEIECVECYKKTKIKKIIRYHLEKEFLCRSCRTNGKRNPMFGTKLSEEKRLEKSNNYKGKNNPFFGKKHTINSKKKISEKNKGKMSGCNNPMYNKSVFDIWVEKYGQDMAKEKWNEKSSKHSKDLLGEKNPFFGKHHSEETIKKLSEIIKKSVKHKSSVNSLEYRINMSGKLKNRKFSDEHRKILRLRRIQKITENRGKMVPSFSVKGCEILDNISKEKSCYIQHALNSGEYHIKELGYWVDGYDSTNNIVYEIDEKSHYDLNGNLKEKDIKRQKEIQEYLGCEFIRIKV